MLPSSNSINRPQAVAAPPSSIPQNDSGLRPAQVSQSGPSCLQVPRSAALDVGLTQRLCAASSSEGAGSSPTDLIARTGGRLDYRAASLAGHDFSGLDLSAADFSGANLRGALFKGAILQSAKFDGADLSGADFSLANLQNASLLNSLLEDTDLSLANLVDAKLGQARFLSKAANRASAESMSLALPEPRPALPSIDIHTLEKLELYAADAWLHSYLARAAPAEHGGAVLKVYLRTVFFPFEMGRQNSEVASDYVQKMLEKNRQFNGMAQVQGPDIAPLLAHGFIPAPNHLEVDQYHLVFPFYKHGNLVDAINAKPTEVQKKIFMRQMLTAVGRYHAQGFFDLGVKDTQFVVDIVDDQKRLVFTPSSKMFRTNTGMTQLGGGGAASERWYQAPIPKKGESSKFCDIWSLGMVFLRMLSGAEPQYIYKAGKLAGKPMTGEGAIMYHLHQGGLPDFPANLSPAAKNFLLRCLQTDPVKRSLVPALLNHPYLAQTQADSAVAAACEKRGGWSFSGLTCNGADFSACDLSGADFRGANLVDTDFSKAVLRGADFSGAVLHRASFAQADLSGTNLTGADFHSANLRGAKLVSAYLENTLLLKADLTNADLSKAHLNNARIADASFFRAVANQAVFENMQLNGNFAFMEIDRAHFLHVSLTPRAWGELHNNLSRLESMMLLLPQRTDGAFAWHAAYVQPQNGRHDSVLTQIDLMDDSAVKLALMGSVLEHALAHASEETWTWLSAEFFEVMIARFDFYFQHPTITEQFFARLLTRSLETVEEMGLYDLLRKQAKILPMLLDYVIKNLESQTKHFHIERNGLINSLLFCAQDSQDSACLTMLTRVKQLWFAIPLIAAIRTQAMAVYGVEEVTELDDYPIFLTADGKQAVTLMPEQYRAMFLPDPVHHEWDQLAYFYQRYDAGTDPLPDHAIVNDKIENLEKLIGRLPVLRNIYFADFKKNRHQSFLKQLNLPQAVLLDFTIAAASRRSTVKYIGADGNAERRDQLRNALGRFVDMTTVSSNGSLPLDLCVSPEFISKVLVAIGKSSASEAEQARSLLVLSAICASYSSMWYFGSDGESVDSLRRMALGLFNSAQHFDAGVLPNKQRILADNSERAWKNRLAGLPDTFTCSASISTEMLDQMKHSSVAFADDLRRLLPPAWL
ncbi:MULTISPECIES: pentapeptide repeat-containing protein [unclassified Undibacterium]|uniref:pentapeptide repeat-containing protein n=1 Tax=unclassified Undibacterium TaxID=2630295 RepID=UPI002AC9ED61|nr:MULTISPECIES: pentapeptide repeat-containing protein [unclassified Undibacterium]MEB0138813.1 pentapeptide repeat-containing protein [Undibacterium sp. CCC2.1]MEB0170711.1 pentapeptide repeat-containing protein [Undibacterium sp. CCC1.1]MEB0174600.1 pentapeptide repeat-containing protein [Undibacterium sp. CCC3.4]MEB0213797.1 pentapeptide repeat-containing protein [Undibacterium sp. 5I2]WPX42525.1 pentapeptide repeat-containing protein [Undibacterium sp. CCC3.4]